MTVGYSDFLKVKGIQRRNNITKTPTTTTTTLQPFYGLFSGTTRVSQCQKRTSGLYGAREDSQRQTQTIRLGATPPELTSAHLHPPFFTGRIPFLPPNLQCQSTVNSKNKQQTGSKTKWHSINQRI